MQEDVTNLIPKGRKQDGSPGRVVGVLWRWNAAFPILTNPSNQGVCGLGSEERLSLALSPI